MNTTEPLETREHNLSGAMRDKLPPIPTPPWVIWREFRQRVLPLAVFFLVVAGIILLWGKVDAGNNIAGIGEGTRSIIASPQLGLLQEVRVRPYEWVTAGQPLALLQPFDPRAKLDLFQSELQIARLQLEPSVADQNALNYERVRVEWLRMKQELALAKVNLEQAESALKRNAALYRDKLVSEDAYELSLKDRNLYQAEIAEKTAGIAEIEERLSKLRPVGEPQLPGTNHPMAELVTRLEKTISQAQTNWAPITLVAPISGMIHQINRQPGEFITDGEPLITINSARSERIVAYLRQPYPIEPQLGMGVEVRTRNKQRQQFLGEINQVGAQIETITNALAFIRQGALVDVGLPIVINVPDGVDIRPGEMVDVFVRPAKGKAGSEGPNTNRKPSFFSNLP